MRTGLARYFLAAAVVFGSVEVTVAQEGPAQGEVAFGNGQRVQGTVTATATDHLTIKSETGEVYEVAITPNTRMMKERQPVKVADVKVGDGVGAMGELDPSKKTVHALFVVVMDAAQVKKLREDLGKTYITGKITAMDDVKLTVQRPDNVSQVIEVDETTSFRKGGRRVRMAMEGGSPAAAPTPTPTITGGESITLADLKVGDLVAGEGSLKHGVFVPTNLMVLPPGAMGARGRRGGEMMTTGPAPSPSSETPKK